jgi:hypothetical protein
MVTSWIVSGWWWWTSASLEGEADRLRLAAERTQTLNRQFAAQMQRERLTLSSAEIASIKQEVAYLNQLAEKRAFSWTQLLSDLEEALPPATSIKRINVDMKDSAVKFDGQAARMQDLTALMASLQARPAFSRPVLHQHRVIDAPKGSGKREDNGAGEPVAIGVDYSITVTYRPVAARGDAR